MELLAECENHHAYGTGSDGFNIGTNEDLAAGQTILHLYPSDTGMCRRKPTQRYQADSLRIWHPIEIPLKSR